ncbi:MAG TPA: hypothetical protein VMO26_30645, partial [Vicinamibacterales bacterium]|nr:hypothetical protein [Vicinamibacterales bacterium]
SSDVIDIARARRRAEDTLRWIVTNLDGLKIPELPTNKRVQLAGGCWHVALEHAGAVVVLVDDRIYGSALAMLRPLAESYIRGLWLAHAASDEEVDDAGDDDFPKDFGKLLRDIDNVFEGIGLVDFKKQHWKRLCSYTHTGYAQIGARLTPEGLGDRYSKADIIDSVRWAELIAMQCLAQFAQLAGSHLLAHAVLDRMRAHVEADKAAREVGRQG